METKKRAKIKYEKEIFLNLIEKYQAKIIEIQKIEQETQFLNRRLTNEKEALANKIKIVKKSLEMLENIGCVIFSLVQGIYKSNLNVKQVWIVQVFRDYNDIYKKVKHEN